MSRNTRQEKLVLSAFLAVALHMFLFEMGPGGADGWSYFAITESIWIDGDLDLANNDYGASVFHVVNGRTVTKYPPGTSLLAGPFVLAARLFEPLVHDWRPDFGERGKSPPYDRVTGPVFVRILAVIAAHNLQVLIGLLLLFRALARAGFPPGAALGATLLSFFATPMLFYAQSGMSEAPSFFLTSLFLWLAVRLSGRPEDPRGWLALGAAAGFSLLVHYRNGLLLPAAALWAVMQSGPGLARAGRVLAVGAGAAVFLWVIPAYNHLQWGAAETVYPDEPFHNPLRFGSPFNIWFALEHGLFLFHPACLLAAAGLFALFRIRDSRWRSLAGLAAGIFVLHSLVCGTHHEWQGPGNFSHHYLTVVFPFLAIGWASWLARSGAVGRWLPWAGAAWTCALFLLATGRLVYDSDGSGWGLSILDYTYVFREGTPLPEILRRIAEGSYTLKALF